MNDQPTQVIANKYHLSLTSITYQLINKKDQGLYGNMHQMNEKYECPLIRERKKTKNKEKCL